MNNEHIQTGNNRYKKHCYMHLKRMWFTFTVESRKLDICDTTTSPKLTHMPLYDVHLCLLFLQHHYGALIYSTPKITHSILLHTGTDKILAQHHIHDTESLNQIKSLSLTDSSTTLLLRITVKK